MPDSTLSEPSQQQSSRMLPACRLRETGECPFSDFCHTSRSENYGFYPEMHDMDKGEYKWSYNTSSGVVTIVESGLLASLILLTEEGDEVPYGIFSKGVINGLVELHEETSQLELTYTLRAISKARVCIIPRSAVNNLMQQHPKLYKETMSLAFTRIAAASAAMCTMLSRKRVYDKLEVLLMILDNLAAQDESLSYNLKLTHEDIAFLVSSDRVSVTRTLAKMQNEGLVNTGYRRVTQNKRISKDEELQYPFFNPVFMPR